MPVEQARIPTPGKGISTLWLRRVLWLLSKQLASRVGVRPAGCVRSSGKIELLDFVCDPTVFSEHAALRCAQPLFVPVAGWRSCRFLCFRSPHAHSGTVPPWGIIAIGGRFDNTTVRWLVLPMKPSDLGCRGGTQI